MPEFQLVDVFARSPRSGNQLAVVLGGEAYSSEAMQEIALEFNFSETTFVLGERAGAHRVRIFTPTAEIPFAGHPTLGTAWVLRKLHGGDRIELDLDAGRTPVRFEDTDDGELGWLTPPPVKLGTTLDRAEGAAVLSLSPDQVSDAFPVQEVSAGIGFLMVPLVGLDALHRIQLDLAVQARLLERGVSAIGVYAFCQGSHTGDADLAVRMQFEAQGVKEDPATGSAAACLGGYALAHGFAADTRIDVRVEQGFEIRRPSLLRIRGAKTDGGPELAIGGACFPFGRGELG